MLGLSWIMAVSLLVVNASPAAPGRPLDVLIRQAPLYVVVPFGEPGDTDPVLRDSTRRFSEDLADHGVRATLGIPIDAVEAVANARSICTQYGAAGILVSEMRFASTKGFNAPEFALGFIPYLGGVISGGGALDRTSIHAQYKLFLVDCRGKVAWRTIATAAKIHHGSNVAAGLTEIGFQAVGEAASEFAARRAQAH